MKVRIPSWLSDQKIKMIKKKGSEMECYLWGSQGTTWHEEKMEFGWFYKEANREQNNKFRKFRPKDME